MVINFAFILILPSTFRWKRNSFSVKFPRNLWVERTPVYPPGIKSGRCNYSAGGDWEWEPWPFIFLFMTCHGNTKTKTSKVFLAEFLLLRALWKVLPLSQQISSTWGFLLVFLIENSLLHPWTTIFSLWKQSFPLCIVPLTTCRNCLL